MLRNKPVVMVLAAMISVASAGAADAGGLLSRLFNKRRCEPVPARYHRCASSVAVCPSASASCPTCGTSLPCPRPRCMAGPPLPPGTHPIRCEARLLSDLRCCRRMHHGYPTVIESCERLALARYQHCRRHPCSANRGVPPASGTGYACDCTDTVHFGCNPDEPYEEYYSCLYDCQNECQYPDDPEAHAASR